MTTKEGAHPESSIQDPVSGRTGPSTSLRTGKSYWRDKMAANLKRDRFVNRELRKREWKVVRIWEHELGESMKDECRRMKLIEKIAKHLNPHLSTLNTQR